MVVESCTDRECITDRTKINDSYPDSIHCLLSLRHIIKQMPHNRSHCTIPEPASRSHRCQAPKHCRNDSSSEATDLTGYSCSG